MTRPNGTRASATPAERPPSFENPPSETRRSRVLRTLRALEPDLRAAGVRHISLFGSVARGHDRADSDIDLALDLEPCAVPSGFQFVAHVERLKQQLAAALGRNVDVVILPARRGTLEEALKRDAVPAF